jgi:hypothetical protein
MGMLRRDFAMTAVAAIGLPLLAAAGLPTSGIDQAKSAAQIFAGAQSAMAHASSFHVLGHIDFNGTAESLNLSLSRHGGGGSLEVSGATMQIVVAAGTVYIKADEKSWLILTKSQSIAQLVADRWIKAPETNADFASFAELTITQRFVGQLMSGSGKLTKLAGTTRVDGREAVVLADSGGNKVYIAATGTPYLLRVSGQGGSSSGSLNFSDFGTAPMPAVPVHAISLPG